MNLANSEKLFKEALRHLSGGVDSPVRAFRAVGGTPIFIEHAEGQYIFDVDGNRYLDFCGSWGPLILGHAHPEVVGAICQTAARGTSFGTVHEGEVILAEKIKQFCPHIEKIRFVSSGTEAVMSAVRVARGYTGRDKIVKFSGCYHGHSDYLLASAGSGLATFGMPSSAGIPEDFTRHTIILKLDDIPGLEETFAQWGGEIAAVIIEPIPANNGLLLQSGEFLDRLREVTADHGALLIFDEVISGFRVAPGGAAELYKIRPDLCTYGKVVGGGLPVGAFGGAEEIMALLAPDGPVYQAGTLSGNPLAMASGLATLRYLETSDGWNRLKELSDRFIGRLRNNVRDEAVQIINSGSIFWMALQENVPHRAEEVSPGSAEKYARLFHRGLDRGIYLAPSGFEVGFISTAHSEAELDDAADKLASIIKEVN